MKRFLKQNIITFQVDYSYRGELIILDLRFLKIFDHELRREVLKTTFYCPALLIAVVAFSLLPRFFCYNLMCFDIF